MTVSKNPTSLKLSMDVENGTNTLAPLSAVSAWTPKPPNASQLPKPSASL